MVAYLIVGGLLPALSSATKGKPNPSKAAISLISNPLPLTEVAAIYRPASNWSLQDSLATLPHLSGGG